MAYNDDSVMAKLAAVNESHDSIATSAQWILFHRRHADRTVQLWAQRVKTSSSTKKLSLVYLANEVAQQSRARHKLDFVNAFTPVIAESIAIAYKGAPSEIQGKLKRVVDVWRDRNVFPEPTQNEIDIRIAELDKAKGSTSGFAHGFGNGASIPSELAPLVISQQSVSKKQLPVRTSVSVASQEYERIMESTDQTAPSPPVFVTRLNGLLKVLATADIALVESIRTREEYISRLEKLLEEARGDLLDDEAKLSQIKSRTSKASEKKSELESSILRNLQQHVGGHDLPSTSSSPTPVNPSLSTKSSGDPSASFSNVGEDGHETTEPERPEVEALTPPTMPPAVSNDAIEDDNSMAKQVEEKVTEQTVDAASASAPVLPGLGFSPDVLARLMSQIAPQQPSHITMDSNDANKRRRLEAEPDFDNNSADKKRRLEAEQDFPTDHIPNETDSSET